MIRINILVLLFINFLTGCTQHKASDKKLPEVKATIDTNIYRIDKPAVVMCYMDEKTLDSLSNAGGDDFYTAADDFNYYNYLFSEFCTRHKIDFISTRKPKLVYGNSDTILVNNKESLGSYYLFAEGKPKELDIMQVLFSDSVSFLKGMKK